MTVVTDSISNATAVGVNSQVIEESKISTDESDNELSQELANSNTQNEASSEDTIEDLRNKKQKLQQEIEKLRSDCSSNKNIKCLLAVLLGTGFTFGGFAAAFKVADKIKKPKLKLALGLGATISSVVAYIQGFRSFNKNVKECRIEGEWMHANEIADLQEQIRLIDEQIKILEANNSDAQCEMVG